MASSSASTAQRQYHCVDDTTIRNLVARVSSEERAHVLNTLSSTYKDSMNSVGFCKTLPVQILSPFEIEPGPLRKRWFEKFAECEANGDFQNLPYLVYWFEPSLGSKTPYITLESWDSVLPCSAGERLDYDRVPKEIEKKIRAKQELTAGEQLICDALAAFEAARDRRLPPCTMKRDEELYMVVKIGKNPGDSDSTGNHGTVDKKKDHSKLSSGIKTPKQLGVSSAEKQIPKNGSNKRDEPPKINHQVMPALKAKQAPPGTKSEISAAPVDLIPRKTSVKKRKAKDSNSPKKKQRKFPPYRLSIELQAIVGTDILPRPQVVSELNKYVKANNLQNPLDGREILCDTKLKRFTKKAKVTFFSMQKSISEHLLEKLDRSAYWHENASEAEGNGN